MEQRELNDFERRELSEAAMDVRAKTNAFNGAERAYRKAKLEYDQALANQWRIATRIHGGRP